MADLNGVIGFVYRYKRRKRPADPPVTTADPTSEAPPPPHLKPRPRPHQRDIKECPAAPLPRLEPSRGGVSPEGVAEVHAPAFQLLGVVGRHVGKLPEDVEVRGVPWRGERRKRWLVTAPRPSSTTNIPFYTTQAAKRAKRPPTPPSFRSTHPGPLLHV